MTAHCAAGTFTFEEGLNLVARRGELMDEACEANPGTMAAMIGGSDEDVARLASDCDVDVANLNCPGQTVLSGKEDSEDMAQATENGLQFIKGREPSEIEALAEVYRAVIGRYFARA